MEANVAKDIEYFLEFKNKYPDVLKDFVRRQLVLNTAEAIVTLEYFQKIIPSAEMNAVISQLNERERDTWKTVVGKSNVIKNPNKVMIYVRTQMTKCFIAAKPMADEDIIELTLKLKASDVVKFCDQYPQSAGDLLNLLNSQFIAQVLDKLEMQKASSLLESALETDAGALNSEELKKSLKAFFTINHKNGFPAKMFKVLESIDPGKEKVIYSQLMRVASQDELAEVACRNCPLDVIWLLPKSVHQEVLQAYPLQKKVRFLMSLDDDKRQLLIEASCPAGSSARQMLEMEVKQIEENPIELKRCMVQKTQLSQEFLMFLRSHVSNNQALVSEVRMATWEWLSQIKSPSSQRLAA